MFMFFKILRKSFLLQYRFYSSNFYIPKEIKIPNKIYRDNTSVLKALANCVKLEPKAIRYTCIDDANLIIKKLGLHRSLFLSKASGKIIAREAFEKIKHDFIKVPEDEPKIKTLMPLISSDEINKNIKYRKITPEKGLLLLINLLKPLEAWEFYQSNINHNFSENCITNLLELLCSTGDIENFTTYTPNEEIFLQEKIDYEWEIDNNKAEVLFRSIKIKTENHYNSIIYGSSKFKNHNRSLELFREMRQIFPNSFPSIKSCNSLLRSLHYKQFSDSDQIVDLIMEILTGMSHYNIIPNVYTFNNAIFAFSNNIYSSSLEFSDFPRFLFNEMKYLNIKPNLGTFSLLLQCKFDRKSQFLMIRDIIEILEKRKEENIFEELSSEDDGKLFVNMSEIIFNLMSNELNHRINKLAIHGGNFPLLGNHSDWSKFGNDFCKVLIKSESDIDVIFSNLKIWTPYFVQLGSMSVEFLIDNITTSNSLHTIPDLIDLVQWFQPKLIKTNSFYRLIQLILNYVDFSIESKLKSEIIDSFNRLFEVCMTEANIDFTSNIISSFMELLIKIDDDNLLWIYIDYFCQRKLILPTLLNILLERFYERNQIDKLFDLLNLFVECIDFQYLNDGESQVFNWLKNEKDSLEFTIDYSKRILPGLLAENNITTENYENIMFKLSDTFGRLKIYKFDEVSEESFSESENDDSKLIPNDVGSDGDEK